MSTGASEATLDASFGIVEASRPLEHDPAYPYPTLRPTSGTESRRFRTIVAENPFLEAVFLPDLGGRLIRLTDRRTGRDILGFDGMIRPVSGGLRGAVVREGIQVQTLAGTDRLNALGPVDSAIAEGEPTAVWFAECAGGTPIGFHLQAQVPPDRAEVLLEARFFNRSLTAQPYNGGLSIAMPGAAIFPTENGAVAYDPDRQIGIGFFSSDPLAVRVDNGLVTVARYDAPGALGARQTDTLSIALVPVSALGNPMAFCREAAIGLDGDRLKVASTAERPAHRLFIATDDGQTLEAPADLHPDRIAEYQLGALVPKAVALRDPAKNDVASTRQTLPTPLPPVHNPSPIVDLDSTETELFAATKSVADRAVAHVLIGIHRLKSRDFAEASEQFERALLFNAEDPLAWWLKAHADRQSGVEGESPELLNAHFLAPLEPVLRAEAFLAQGAAQGREPNPLIAPLAEIPENLVEVACLLIEAGLLMEANQWIDEALRHRDLPILHLLHAYALRQGTRMEAETAHHLALARDLSEPPYPYRDVERRAMASFKTSL